MGTTRFLLGIFWFAAAGGPGLFEHRYLLRQEPAQINTQELAKRLKLVETAEKEIGVREKTGNNDGQRVEAYLKIVGLKSGEPYCAAFVSWVYRQNGYAKPRSGWCPDLFPASRLARSALPGDVMGIYFSEKKRIAHVGLVDHLKGHWCISIEANTDVTGSREGEGVYKKIRHLKTIYAVANWVKTGRRTQ